ncbi:MAG TPA: hypothetical protein VF747_06610 [Blastocatellia bacterium]|jgi:hypothetical protein
MHDKKKQREIADPEGVRYRVMTRGGKEWLQRLCDARDNTCGRLAMAHSPKCRQDGGATPRGAASVHTKTGEHSKDFQTRFRKRAEEFLANRDGKELARAIAYATTLVEDAVERVDSFESGAAWLAAQDAMNRNDRWSAKKINPGDEAARAEQLAEVERASDDLRRAIKQGVAEHHSKEELRKHVEFQTKLVERETGIEVKTGMMVAFQELIAASNRTYDILMKYVEPSKRADLLDELSGMVAPAAQRSFIAGH